MTKKQLNTALTRCIKVLETANNCCGRIFVTYDYEYFNENGRGVNGSWSLEITLTSLNSLVSVTQKITGDDDENQLIFKPAFEAIRDCLEDMDLEIGVFALNPGDYSVIEVD